jgi:hypothetical protein
MTETVRLAPAPVVARKAITAKQLNSAKPQQLQRLGRTMAPKKKKEKGGEYLYT